MPVVSKKTGTVYEKRLIEKYIEEHGKEPGTEEELDVEDLLPLKAGRIVRPRPPTLTSIPALLATFQNEWDALALETYNLQEHLAQTRMELATALYQHDAAIRVIARLTKERDEARDSLSRVTVAVNGVDNGDSMAVDAEELPEALSEAVDATHKKYVSHLVLIGVSDLLTQSRLSKLRKKRTVPKAWASNDDIASFEQMVSEDLPVTQATSIAVEGSGNYAAVTGLDGSLDIFSVAAQKLERELEVEEPLTTAVWSETKILVGTSKGSVKIFEAGNEVASLKEHAGAVTGLAVHPSGLILASVGVDKTIAMYDLETRARVSRAHSNACMFDTTVFCKILKALTISSLN